MMNPLLLWQRALQIGHVAQFRWPIYDVLRYLRNRAARSLYRNYKMQMAPSPIEKRVIQELKENGVSVIHLNDLLPRDFFGALKDWAETRLKEPENQDKIRTIEAGGKPTAKFGKFFIVRLLGDFPQVGIGDSFMEMNLSDPVLRIISGYFGMFIRLSAVDLWCNVPTEGPDQFSQRWHRDPEERKIVKMFLYIRDVDENNGPFCYIRGSHNEGPFKRICPQRIRGYNYPENGFVEKRIPPHLTQVCTGKAGTLIFCDTSGFHRGGHPKTGLRLMSIAEYTSNGGEPLITNTKQYSLTPSRTERLSPSANYAIGHLQTHESITSTVSLRRLLPF